MSNEEREFSFTTQRMLLGEQKVPLGDDANPDPTKAVGISESQNVEFASGVIEPDYSPIPDSDDLQSHLDASDKTDISSTWTAEIGPDLSAVGSPSIKSSEKNGHNVVSYNGTDSGHSASFSSGQSQPVHLFFTFRFNSLAVSNPNPVAATTTDFRFEVTTMDNNQWRMYAGSIVEPSGGGDTDWHVGSLLYNNDNSTLRIDGSTVASGNVGSNSWSGVSLGYNAHKSGQWADIDIGEYLGYPQNKSGIQADIEAYLSDKWNIPL